MIIDIPDLLVSVFAVFAAGFLGFYVYDRINMARSGKEAGQGQSRHLEHYQNMLIELKIRLDALELKYLEEVPRKVPSAAGQAGRDVQRKTPETEVRAAKAEVVAEPEPQRSDIFAANNITEQVLHLITTKSHTSRDIQITLGKSREHVSRLMKRMFEDGYVTRNVKTKPYTYSITSRGKKRIGVEVPAAAPAAST